MKRVSCKYDSVFRCIHEESVFRVYTHCEDVLWFLRSKHFRVYCEETAARLLVLSVLLFCRALLSEYMALWSEYMALLSKDRALLSECMAILSALRRSRRSTADVVGIASLYGSFD